MRHDVGLAIPSFTSTHHGFPNIIEQAPQWPICHLQVSNIKSPSLSLLELRVLIKVVCRPHQCLPSIIPKLRKVSLIIQTTSINVKDNSNDLANRHTIEGKKWIKGMFTPNHP